MQASQATTRRTDRQRQAATAAVFAQKGSFQEQKVRNEPGSDFPVQESNAFIARLFSDLAAHAVALKGGANSWRLDLPHGGESALMGPHFYAGTSGVAFFCAAYYRVTGNVEARNLALHSIAPLEMKMLGSAAADHRATAVLIGGFIGLGSFLYTFTRLAGWLDSPSLVDAATAVSSWVTPDRISEDEKFDIVNGTAGTLLALLAFEKLAAAGASARQRALEMAALCGEHLLCHRATFKSNARGWPGRARPPISGFAHGAAGIAYALSRLFERTREKSFLDAAEEAFDFERSLYDPQTRTWFDPRFNCPLQHVAWCHGAPGIALARLASLDVIDTKALRSDINEALDITVSLPLTPLDDLCCGNFGRVDILHTASQHLQQSDFLYNSWKVATQVLTRAAANGFYFGTPDQNKTQNGTKSTAYFNPSFFRGLSGVGYALLRLIHPRVLPNVLLLQ